MPVPVIDFLKITNVNHERGYMPAVCRRGVLVKRQPVFKTGQAVSVACIFQRFIAFFKTVFLHTGMNMTVIMNRIAGNRGQAKNQEVQRLNSGGLVDGIRGQIEARIGSAHQEGSEPGPENNKADHDQVYNKEGQHLITDFVMADIDKDGPDGKKNKERDFENKKAAVPEIRVPGQPPGKKQGGSAENDAKADAAQAD
jgi:hypothetical protein